MAAEDNSERSNPVKRIRWATQRVTGKKGVQKRRSIFQRHAARLSNEKKRESAATDPDLGKPDPASPRQETRAGDDDGEGEAHETGRTVWFNIPLPSHARDEEGKPLQTYKRNKIRTARYTALSFIPKDLWLQFHNIANIYFLAVIILDVRMSTSLYLG